MYDNDMSGLLIMDTMHPSRKFYRTRQGPIRILMSVRVQNTVLHTPGAMGETLAKKIQQF
jgi:hypothetical protein